MWQRNTLMQLEPGVYYLGGMFGILAMRSEQEKVQQNLPVVYYFKLLDNGQEKLITQEEFMGLLLSESVSGALGKRISSCHIAMDVAATIRSKIRLLSSATSPTTI